ncbi:MAG: glycosyl hydrolase family 95 catalytic domain-containing protein [Verrucomicrobiota bacterium JB025]|nr:hypothetical protein [Verrucomicrobiota bacterium JB025]
MLPPSHLTKSLFTALILLCGQNAIHAADGDGEMTGTTSAVAGLDVPAEAQSTLITDSTDEEDEEGFWPDMLAKHDMVWGSLPESWDEAPFLGNGEQGTMMHKIDNQTLRWDVGCSAAHDHRSIDDDDLSEKNVATLNRGRLFIGHLELELPAVITGSQSRLSLWDAEATGTLASAAGSVTWHTLVHATEPVMRFEITPTGDLEGAGFTYVAEEARNPRAVRAGTERTPANPSPVLTTLDDGVETAVHNLWAGGQTAVAYYEEETNGVTRLWLSVRHSYPGSTAEDSAVAAVRAAVAADQAGWIQTHRDWWHNYYPDSFVSTGDPYWDAFYWIQQYKLACATRDRGWIIDNQGPWLQPTAWNATWWNLNVQLSHSGTYKANRRGMASAMSHRLDINRDALARNVNEAYRTDSYAIGRTVSGWDLLGHAGEPGGRDEITADANIAKECGDLLWALHSVDLETRYWQDTALRDDVLYPLLTRAVNYYIHFLVEEADGLYHLPSTYSPEYASAEDCSYDLDLLRWATGRLLELAAEQGLDSAGEPLLDTWTDIQTRLVPTHTNETGLMLGRNRELTSGHRHFSHLLSVYPLRTLTPETSGNRELIQTSLDHWQSFGSGIAGYAFTGASCMASLLGDGDAALSYLNGLKSYLQPSTMYSEIGLPVIETPLHGAAAIQEMLLQSWGGRLRVFPAVPSSWTDVQFQKLRGEGAFLTTASRAGGATQWVLVEAEAGGTVEVEPQLVGAQWTSSAGATVSNVSSGVYSITTTPGDWVLFWPGGKTEPAVVVEPVAQRGDDHRFGLPDGYVEDDLTPPSPDPMSFALPPAAFDASTITMTATTASDISVPVEYDFENTTTGDNSGWTTDPTWSNTGLTAGQSYTFRVRARDSFGNVGNWSDEASAVPAEDTTAPDPSPMTWASAPAALSARIVSMTATTATDPVGVEYYFTNTTVPDGSHDSGWQDSPDYIDTGLSPETSYSYTVTARDKSANANQGTASATATATTLSELSVLFADTFDRADDTDLNASTDGKSGSLGALNYSTRTFNSVTLDLHSNNLRINGPASNGSYGGLVYISDYNFADAAIASGGSLIISVDIAAYSSAGSSRQMTVGMGQSAAELDAQPGVAPGDHSSDLLVAYRATTGALEIYKNGVLDASETIPSGLPDAPATMRIETTFSDFNAGSTALYQVYFDDSTTAFASGSFSWSGTNENYISLSSNLSNDALFDNLEIQGATAVEPASSPVAGVDFENADDSAFDSSPDDLDPTDGITVAAGWSLAGNALEVKSDDSANAAGSTTGSFVAKLNGGTNEPAEMPELTPSADHYSWSLTIPAGVTLNLSAITFDIRQGTATAGNTRWAMFNTSLDGGPGSAPLWAVESPPLRGDGWEHASVDLGGAIYQNLTNTTVTFHWYNEWSGSDIDSIIVYGSTGGASDDYSGWTALYPAADLTDPTADHDGDGLGNNEERIWGLDPTSARSATPYATPVDATGTFSYTRRAPDLTGLAYTIWTSTDLSNWAEDNAATQTVESTDANDVETVTVTLGAAPADGRLFVRIQAQ